MRIALRFLVPALALALGGCLDGDDGRYASGPGYGGYGGGYNSGYGGGYRGGDAWTEPRPGVRCNRVERVCYDRGGPELSVTREFFGSDAARRLERQTGGNWRRDDTYNPQAGVRCDLGDEVCKKKGQEDYRTTRQQFGRNAAQQVQDNDGNIRPGKKTVCDPDDRTCVKNGQVNVDQTRFVFGNRAARDARNDKKRNN